MENRLLEAQLEASKWFQTSNTMAFCNDVWVDAVAEQRWQERWHEQGHILPHSIVVTGTDTAINGTYSRISTSYKDAPRYGRNVWNGFLWTCHEVFLVAERGDPKILWWMIAKVRGKNYGLPTDTEDQYLYRAQQKREDLIRPPQSGWIPMRTSGSAPPSLTLTFQH